MLRLLAATGTTVAAWPLKSCQLSGWRQVPPSPACFDCIVSCTRALSSAASAAAAVVQDCDGSEAGLQLHPDQQPLSTLLTGAPSSALSAAEVGLYYKFKEAMVPEAFQRFHQAFYSPRAAGQQRKGGCRSLQAELATTKRAELMWRRCSQEVSLMVDSGVGDNGRPLRLHLRGPAGCGKSIVLAQTVERARSCGWIALYVPSAVDLTRGGFFAPRKDGTYDTLISAQHVVKALTDAHGEQLGALPALLPESMALLSTADGSSSLADLAALALQADDAQLAVDCALLLLRELCAAAAPPAPLTEQQQEQQEQQQGLAVPTGTADRPLRVLLAVDDYNALHWRTDYGRSVSRTPKGRPPYFFRQEIPVDDLNLARGLRLLQRDDLGHAVVVAADSASARVPQELEVPVSQDTWQYYVPRYSAVETAHALFHYHETGLVPAPPSERQVTKLRALSNGNGAELRRWCVSISQTDVGML